MFSQRSAVALRVRVLRRGTQCFIVIEHIYIFLKLDMTFIIYKIKLKRKIDSRIPNTCEACTCIYMKLHIYVANS